MIWDRPERMNRLTSLLWWLGIMLVGATGVLIINRMPVFQVRDVIVTNPLERVQVEALRTGIAPYLNGNFFTVDLAAIRQAAEKQPWVYRVDVRRQGLNSLTLDVEEQVPVARWGSEGSVGASDWLNRDGNVFEVPDQSLGGLGQGLPVLHGPIDTGSDLLARYQRYNALLQPTGRTIRQLELSPRLSWSMRLDNGMRVEMGRESVANATDEQVNLFVSLYPQLTNNRSAAPAVVDLRYPAGVAVRYPASPTTPSTPSDHKGKS